MKRARTSETEIAQGGTTVGLPLFTGEAFDSAHRVRRDAFVEVAPNLGYRQRQVLDLLRQNPEGLTTSEITHALGLGERVHKISGRIAELRSTVFQGRALVVFAGRRGTESIWRVPE
jgi:hypothetical protein